MNSKWLHEAVVQRGTNDVFGKAPSDMGSDNEDSVFANDEYGADKDEKNLVKEAEPVRSEKDIRLLRKLGYSEERISRIDRSEADTILYHRMKANKMGESNIKEKAEAFWTEVDENLFTKASMTVGKTFLPGEDEDEDDENIDEHHEDQYNVNAGPATPDHEVDEKSPEGWEGTVKSMKKHKDVDNPYALSHWMKNKGYKSHKTKSGKDKPNEDKSKSLKSDKFNGIPSRSKSAHGVAPAQTGPAPGSAAQRSLDRIVRKRGRHK